MSRRPTELEALVLRKMLESDHGVTIHDFPGTGMTEESLERVIDGIDELLGDGAIDRDELRLDN